MGGLSGETDTWLPRLTSNNCGDLSVKALHEQGFFVMGPLYVTAELRQPGVNVDLCRVGPVLMHSDPGCYDPGRSYSGYGY